MPILPLLALVCILSSIEGASGDVRASVAVVGARDDPAVRLAVEVALEDLAACRGIRLVKPGRSKLSAALPAGRAVAPGDAGAIARALKVTHVVLIDVAPQGDGSALHAWLAPAGGEPIALCDPPRRFSGLPGVRYPTHQVANLVALRLAGKPLRRTSGIFEDRLKDKDIGIVRVPPGMQDRELSGIELSLQVDRPGGVYRVREHIECVLKADRDCYIALYSIDCDGRPRLLVPSSDCERAKVRREKGKSVSTLRIKAGVRYRVPQRWTGEDAALGVLEGQPTGFESLVAVASTEPVLLPIKALAGKDLIIEPVSAAQLAEQQESLLQQSSSKVRVGRAEVRFTTTP